ncbi:uncharacterized protein JCM6883_000479 [Sporobolomyces salmoneus]|uniref:uncharacterized protein n=1 Tax=Sporobolomyces salmoneus TaxID=183962 RepID=UPI00316DBFBF
MSRPPSPSQSIQDPTERWEIIRSSWLTPSSSSSTSSTKDSSPPPSTPSTNTDDEHSRTEQRRKSPRDTVFTQRIQTLEQMLRAANSGQILGGSPSPLLSASTAPSAVPTLLETPITLNGGGTGKGKEKEKEKEVEAEEVPDDGFAVGGEKKGSTQELKKISEGIFLAFKQGRALKEPLPLSLVTSLLYRSWLIDGTVPRDYCRSRAEPDPEMPRPNSTMIPPAPFGAAPILSHLVNDQGGGDGMEGERSTPSPLAVLSEMNPQAVTPLPSGTEGDASGGAGERIGEGETGCTNTPEERLTPRPSGGEEEEESTKSMPPPSLPSILSSKPGIQPLQVGGGGSSGGSNASLEGMGADESSGKLKLDVLRGSRWRTEKDVASGSDII